MSACEPPCAQSLWGGHTRRLRSMTRSLQLRTGSSLRRGCNHASIRRLNAALATVIGVVLIAFVVAAYQRRWGWTGFVATQQDAEAHPARSKTLWEWLELLIVPAGLAIGLLLLSNTQAARDRQRDERTAARDKAAAADSAHAQILRDYLQQMADLMLQRRLLSSRPGSPVRTVASTLTLTVVHQLDGARKGLVLQFLVGSELIDPHDPVVQLEGADLTDLRAPPGLTADRMDLDRTDLERADFHNAALLGGRSSHRSGKATFERADLRHANFENVELVDVVFLGTDLRNADFRDQVLEDQIFTDDTCLSGASFRNADLRDADFVGAGGLNVDFRGADLRRAAFEISDADAQRIAAANPYPELLDPGSPFKGPDSLFGDLQLQGAKLGGATLPQDWGPTGLRMTGAQRRTVCRSGP